MMYRFFVLLFFFTCCQESDNSVSDTLLFQNVTDATEIEFSNDLTFTERLNPYTYRNFYNGAGVAIGDINNDGLSDIYFTGNQVDNKLYLNKGDFKFEDITESAGVRCQNVWSTGVTFVDINADGFLDIYVCKSGDPESKNRHNELFINNGDLTFTEKSAEYGLDIEGLSVQAAFFDYDKDGDLDCYLLTNSVRSIGNYDLRKNQRNIPDSTGGGNKFFVNENNVFIDKTNELGIYSSKIGFGLGITLADFNNDDWVDVFISNDFFERDYLYINDKKGAFKESLTSYFSSISLGSMGADAADLNNDGNTEIFVTEMLPNSLKRKKTKTLYESWNKYRMSVDNGYHNQYPRNVLQSNISDTTFLEVGRYAGVSATEWSWGALMMDMDNDGLKDIFIANGIYKDLLDRDYLNYYANDENIREMINTESDVITKLVQLMPSTPSVNYAYKNEGNLNFKNMSQDWGLVDSTFSNGSAYGDLDNDGDLDLLLNNVNSPAIIYRNNVDTSNNKSISILLNSKSKNTFEIGSKVSAYCGDNVYVIDNYTARGFQSSVDNKIILGLGSDVDQIDSLVIKWATKGFSTLYNVKPNTFLNLQKEHLQVEYKAQKMEESNTVLKLKKISKRIPNSSISKSTQNDFNRNGLLPFMFCNEMPKLTKVDVDGDGKQEVYLGGSKDIVGQFIHFDKETVSTFPNEITQTDKIVEESNSLFLDVDSDGDQDYYMASGGNFFPKTSSVYMDKLFINDGKGNFSESQFKLPFKEYISTSDVVAIDFDNDEDLDLVIGERFHPFYYGKSGKGFLFQNEGNGKFIDVTSSNASYLKDAGMITDITVADYNNDGWDDLVIVGDWMPITFLKNNQGIFVLDPDQDIFSNATKGWWSCSEGADLNNDGLIDFVLGNHGLNSFFKEGDRMYISDFDQNGSIEQIYCTKVEGKYYPILDKDELVAQLPSLKKDLVYYKDYAEKSMDELFSQQIINSAEIKEVEVLKSSMVLSSPNGYKLVSLPSEVQLSSVYAILIHDLDGDGILDLLVGGNQFLVKPQFGRYDASKGWYFKGKFVNDEFSFENGISLNIEGQIRDFEIVETETVKYLVVSKNNEQVELYEVSF